MLMACDEDSTTSPSASEPSSESISVDFRVDSTFDLVRCSEELDGKIAFVKKDSTWLVCKLYVEDDSKFWFWRSYVYVNGKLYPYADVPAGSYDCNVNKCVSTEYLNPNITYGEYQDYRDHKVYKTVHIGKQLWMAQNLVYTDGNDSLTGANLFSEDSLKKGYYYLASDPCPGGWKVPTRKDIAELVEFTGDKTMNVLKSSKESWIVGDTELTDPYGFSLVKSAYIIYITEDEDYYRNGLLMRGEKFERGASLWLERNNSVQTWYIQIYNTNQNYSIAPDSPENVYMTVRCIAKKGY